MTLIHLTDWISVEAGYQLMLGWRRRDVPKEFSGDIWEAAPDEIRRQAFWMNMLASSLAVAIATIDNLARYETYRKEPKH